MNVDGHRKGQNVAVQVQCFYPQPRGRGASLPPMSKYAWFELGKFLAENSDGNCT